MDALTNPAPAAPLYQFGDAQQQAIIDLAEISESAIAKPALPIVVTLQHSVLTFLPPSPRLTLPIVVTPQPSVLTFPPPSPRVTFPPVSLRVPLPVHINVIEPEYNGDNVDAVIVPRNHLWFHRQPWRLADQEPHHIAANTSFIAQPYSTGVIFHFARATRHLIANEHQHTNHANTVINTVTGQYL